MTIAKMERFQNETHYNEVMLYKAETTFITRQHSIH